LLATVHARLRQIVLASSGNAGRLSHVDDHVPVSATPAEQRIIIHSTVW
jgi:hypothetical protein